MRISHKHKFIFYAIPKTGSSSIRQYFFKELEEEDDPKSFLADPDSTFSSDDWEAWNFHHTKFNNVRKHFETVGYNYDDYIKFAFVRNPWGRELSAFHEKKRNLEMGMQYAKTLEKEMGGLDSFEKYIKSDRYREPLDDRDQLDWIDHGNDPKFFVFKFENLQKDFDSMIQLINAHSDAPDLSKSKLDHRQIGEYKHIPYKEYYDEEMKEIVSKTCAKDIEMFNYEFEE
tara:strand:+ start:1357 stop:2043 length:687 start_codon:yes stop_codon:yes gene_type:complete